MNITDSMAPYFNGEISLDEATSRASELFIRTFEEGIFACPICDKIIRPKVTANEDGIFIETKYASIRGGKGNLCIKKNVCEDCVRKMSMKG